MRALRNVKFLAVGILLLLIVGTLGFHFIEGWPLFDGLYMTLTTLTTIGYQETHPLSHAGRVFNIFMIVAGVGLVFLLIGSLTQALIEFEFQVTFGRRKMEREIGRLSDHYIICGAGRVGRSVAHELVRKPASFVIIEGNQAKADRFREDFPMMMVGDATQEAVLRQARIEHARGLVAATTTDASNTYIVLTARAMNPKLKIIARASEEDAEKHLRTAGADVVVSPYTFAGHRIAHSFPRPNVVDFIDVAMVQQEKLGLEIEEILIEPTSSFAGQTVSGSKIRQDLGVIVLAIKRPGEPMHYNPASNDKIEAGDNLIVMGPPEQLRRMEGIAGVKA
jgi:voltage-gated potassium channel